ncbi:MAG: hypothetical protein HQL26_09775 [Candidatus Omnitrophica bacterium]|nr:hypothetical protein [Candidatus Omnitrophota bacterium]
MPRTIAGAKLAVGVTKIPGAVKLSWAEAGANKILEVVNVMRIKIEKNFRKSENFDASTVMCRSPLKRKRFHGKSITSVAYNILNVKIEAGP